MLYPKKCFCIKEDVTRANMKAYEIKREKWYEMARKMYPDYDDMSLRMRVSVREYIDNEIGYSLY